MHIHRWFGGYKDGAVLKIIDLTTENTEGTEKLRTEREQRAMRKTAQVNGR